MGDGGEGTVTVDLEDEEEAEAAENQALGRKMNQERCIVGEAKSRTHDVVELRTRSTKGSGTSSTGSCLLGLCFPLPFPVPVATSGSAGCGISRLEVELPHRAGAQSYFHRLARYHIFCRGRPREFMPH